MTINNKIIPIRISVSEAARLFGVSTKTVRQAIKANEVRYIISRGRYRITFESLLKWSQLSTRRRNQFTKDGIGRYVEKWHISNKKYSPNRELVEKINFKNKNS